MCPNYLIKSCENRDGGHDKNDVEKNDGDNNDRYIDEDEDDDEDEDEDDIDDDDHHQ